MAGSSIMGGSNIPLNKITNGTIATPENLQEVALVKGKIYRDRDTGLFHYCHTARAATSGVLDVMYLDLTPASIESLAELANDNAIDLATSKAITDDLYKVKEISTLSYASVATHTLPVELDLTMKFIYVYVGNTAIDLVQIIRIPIEYKDRSFVGHGLDGGVTEYINFTFPSTTQVQILQHIVSGGDQSAIHLIEQRNI